MDFRQKDNLKSVVSIYTKFVPHAVNYLHTNVHGVKFYEVSALNINGLQTKDDNEKSRTWFTLCVNKDMNRFRLYNERDFGDDFEKFIADTDFHTILDRCKDHIEKKNDFESVHKLSPEDYAEKYSQELLNESLSLIDWGI